MGFVVRIALLVTAWLGMAQTTQADVQAVWVGQVPKDLVGPFGKIAPSDTQDLQFRLERLLPNVEIENIRIVRRGGGEWQYNGPPGAYAAAVERVAGSTYADVYVEPQYTEAECQWDIIIRYADGSIQSTSLMAGRSNKTLRMPEAQLSADWLGQDGRDWTGRRAAVGPDGIQDVVLKINGLSDKLGVLMGLRIEVEDGPAWEYGPNPDKFWNAELFRESDKSRSAELLISPPEQSIAGKPLKLTVFYGYGREHSFTGSAIAGRSNPTLKTPPPRKYNIRQISRFTAQWLGQDGSDITGRGDVHVRVSGLPTRAPIVAAVLSSDTGGHWAARVNDSISVQMPRAGRFTELAFRPVSGSRGTADLYFPPFRDERDGRMTLRVILADGTQHFGQFDGGPCDPALRGKLPNDKSITVKPGDDLHAIVREYGHVILSPGTYHFDRALELHEPITLTGPREAVLLFRQPATQEHWHEAILVLADNITLDGFSIRFDGPVHWKPFDWTRGCGVIQAPRRTKPEDELVNLIVRNMDIQDSELADPDPAKLQWLPDLVRCGRVLNGQITGNTFRGGTIDVEQGPWLIADNVHRGAPAGGMAPAAFAGHYIHDVTVENNRVEGEHSPGKLWRFLVITQEGAKTIVCGNDIRGIGVRDDDQMPHPNSPEIFLTEAYRLHYEGEPIGVTAGGYVLQIPLSMWSRPRPGSVVAILDGEHAGKWFKIAQPIDDVTYLLNTPMPAGKYSISVATGLVDELYENNRIDNRGGLSEPIQLCGTSFNTVIRNNHILGGRMVLLKAPPTEYPGNWGWSLCPTFDMTFEDNILEDMRAGLVLETHHSQYTKSVPGRLYQTMVVRNNIIRWTSQFLEWHLQHNASEDARQQPTWRPLQAIRIGAIKTPTHTDLRLELTNNRVIAPAELRDAATAQIIQATVNGEPLRNQILPLPFTTP